MSESTLNLEALNSEIDDINAKIGLLLNGLVIFDKYIRREFLLINEADEFFNDIENVVAVKIEQKINEKAIKNFINETQKIISAELKKYVKTDKKTGDIEYNKKGETMVKKKYETIVNALNQIKIKLGDCGNNLWQFENKFNLIKRVGKNFDKYTTKKVMAHIKYLIKNQKDISEIEINLAVQLAENLQPLNHGETMVTENEIKREREKHILLAKFLVYLLLNKSVLEGGRRINWKENEIYKNAYTLIRNKVDNDIATEVAMDTKNKTTHKFMEIKDKFSAFAQQNSDNDVLQQLVSENVDIMRKALVFSFNTEERNDIRSLTRITYDVQKLCEVVDTITANAEESDLFSSLAATNNETPLKQQNSSSPSHS